MPVKKTHLTHVSDVGKPSSKRGREIFETSRDLPALSLEPSVANGRETKREIVDKAALSVEAHKKWTM